MQKFDDYNYKNLKDIPEEYTLSKRMNRLERGLKRLGDFTIALGCTVLFLPLFLFCYVMVKKEDCGPAFFKQERIGRYGKPFIIYKFRTMRVDAEQNGPQLSHQGGMSDGRLTNIGVFLRGHHLDELPQLWNVLKGDMAFVGHRPERMFFIKQILAKDKRYEYLYQMRPGVTSYATLFNGYTDSMEKMLKRLDYDLLYLQKCSLWLDTKILSYTFYNIILGNKF